MREHCPICLLCIRHIYMAWLALSRPVAYCTYIIPITETRVIRGVVHSRVNTPTARLLNEGRSDIFRSRSPQAILLVIPRECCAPDPARGLRTPKQCCLRHYCNALMYLP
ncbi:hypothetical protein F4819DRAFT_471456 [Hypoxylon fuscum]|nr:hypothetical protein F4819DRAFT_471456 [Hypoxylon fuscum]